MAEDGTAGALFYLLACRECGDPERPLVMPFGSAAERGGWASGHTRATGHDRWWVKDVKDELTAPRGEVSGW